MKKNIKEFRKNYNLTLNQFLGIDLINGDLYLSSLTSIPDNFNPTVGGSLYLRSLTSIPDNFNPTVGGSLDLCSLTSIPDNFNPTVGGYLYLNSLTSIPDNFNPTVGGGLDLSSLTSIPDNFNPTVGGSLYLDSLTSIPDNFNPTVGRDLYLYSLTSIPDNFNPTVGGYLDLYSLTSIPDNFNPTVGGDLDLSSLKSIPDNFNPTVGGDLYLSSLTCNYTKLPTDSIISWKNGKYIKVDGIFTEVISHRGNVYRVKKLNTNKVFYIVSNGIKWSHGETLKEAKTDLLYKLSNKTKDSYLDLTMDSVLSFEECIECYRVLTGACSFGTKDFVQNRLFKKKSSYSIGEIIDITKGEYGSNKFSEFFNKIN